MTNRPRIIEIAGLGGTGKSTLFRFLQRKNKEIKIFALPKTWFVWSLTKRSPLWLPFWLQNHRAAGGFTREQLISLGCLDAWLPYIRQSISTNQNIAVLDPGSVYWLTKLRGFGLKTMGQSLYQSWWESKFKQWSSALDVIIWLDAPEELCLQRILARKEWHHAKYMEANDVLERFRGLRKSYEQIINRMASKGSKKIFYFRTDQVSTDQIIDQIISEVDLAPLCQTQPCTTDPSKPAFNSSI